MTRYRIDNFIWSDKEPGRVSDRLGGTYRCFSCDSLLQPGDGTLCRDCVSQCPASVRKIVRANMMKLRIPTKDEFREQGDQI